MTNISNACSFVSSRIASNRRLQLSTFSTSSGGLWLANFRDFNAAVTRMATLAPGGRINTDVVTNEIARLESSWRRRTRPKRSPGSQLSELLSESELADIDHFDRTQLEFVTGVCRQLPSLSAVGRHLFRASRTKRRSVNDADRIRKYLSRFGLEFAQIVTQVR